MNKIILIVALGLLIGAGYSASEIDDTQPIDLKPMKFEKVPISTGGTGSSTLITFSSAGTTSAIYPQICNSTPINAVQVH